MAIFRFLTYLVIFTLILSPFHGDLEFLKIISISAILAFFAGILNEILNRN
jgi:hypothetical protein